MGRPLSDPTVEPEGWECSNCGAINPHGEDLCENCGADTDGALPEDEDEEDVVKD